MNTLHDILNPSGAQAWLACLVAACAVLAGLRLFTLARRIVPLPRRFRFFNL